MVNEWYVFKEQQRKGPFTWEQLLEQSDSGDIEPDDQVWSDDTSGWVPASEVKGLFRTSPPPPPPPIQASSVPEAPSVSEATDVPEAHSVSEVTDVPEAPSVSEVTNVPEAPSVSEVTNVPEAPSVSETPSEKPEKSPENIKVPAFRKTTENLAVKGARSQTSISSFLMMLFLCTIPILNVVLLLIWSFSSKVSTIRKNLARALLIWVLIIAIVCVTIYMAWYFSII